MRSICCIILFAATIYVANGIVCYQCNSTVVWACKDPFANDDRDIVQRDCATVPFLYGTHVCFKKAEFNKQRETMFALRGCCNLENFEFHDDAAGYSGICKKDLCNVATRAGAAGLLFVAFALFSCCYILI